MALKSFGELQRVNEEREQALRISRKEAEELIKKNIESQATKKSKWIR